MFMNSKHVHNHAHVRGSKAQQLLWVLLASMLFMIQAPHVYAGVSPIVGGSGGATFTDPAPLNQIMTGINLGAGNRIFNLQGVTEAGTLPYHGGAGGSLIKVTWPETEYLTRVYGTYYPSSYIGQISFVTNKGRILGPYGTPSYPTKRVVSYYFLRIFPIYKNVPDFQSFDYTVPAGQAIQGFTGRSGANIDALGVVYNPDIITALFPSSLRGIKPPSVPGLTSADSSRSDIVTPVVTNKAAAIALGKALFWDQQIGSDYQACASCHFHAGGDSRLKNQINPGLAHITSPDSKGSWYLSADPNSAPTSFAFQPTKSGAAKSGPNYTLKKADFPFNPANDDVASSQGTFAGDFKKVGDGLVDTCDRSPDVVYNVKGVGTRKVEPRNTPTMINAAYNHRNFWDGRANNVFNGVSPFGLRDKNAGVFINMNNSVSKKPLNLINSSLASQAVGPVLSDFEMSCAKRGFADVGRKVLSKKPLAFQKVDPQDSVLTPTYLGYSYAELVKLAFNGAYWNVNCNGACGTPADGSAAYSQMEANFSMFFGLAVQLYEETLVSDDTKFDRWKEGKTSFTAQEQQGWDVFTDKGKCVACHNGPLFTSAAIETNKAKLSFLQVIQRMHMLDGGTSIYDEGFYNTAVVPNEYDAGVGGVDPWNNPLSFSKQFITQTFVDKFKVDTCSFEVPFSPNCSSLPANLKDERLDVIGAFKTSGLRNIALTGPYMHNGSMATLEQTVEFYNRGGNFNNFGKHPDMQPLGLNAAEQAALVAFMKTLTDDRVAYERAPFDHPELKIPYGHPGDENNVTAGNPIEPKLAVDDFVTLPAVGKTGRTSALPSFEQVLDASPFKVSLPYGTAKCANENQNCVIPTGKKATVWYGAGEKWNVKTLLQGTIACSNAYFGDPIPGTVKSCMYL